MEQQRTDGNGRQERLAVIATGGDEQRLSPEEDRVWDEWRNAWYEHCEKRQWGVLRDNVPAFSRWLLRTGRVKVSSLMAMQAMLAGIVA